MDYVVIIGQLVASLSILIVLHEMGHFFPAKLFGTRVEKFYLFFDPGFSLFKYKRGETEYGIGWLPLGGYVKISGMIDESMDVEQMKQPPQPWEFRSKPAWQRLVIMLGGVTVNFILGFLLFGMVLWIWGEEYLPAENAKYGIAVDSLGMDMGLMDGDYILKVGEVPFDKFSDRIVVKEIVINNAKTLEIKRDDREKILPIDETFTDILSRYENKNRLLFLPRLPFIAESFSKDSPAKKAGILKDDAIIGVNGIPTPFYSDFRRVTKDFGGQEIDVRILRNKSDSLNIPVTLDENARIGIFRYGPGYFFETAREEYTLLQALPAGVVKGYTFLSDQIKAFGQMFKGKIKASESLGGFGAIAGLFPSSWIWEDFWRITAILSLILAFMNLLPIPALDGGHVMFLLYEVVTGRKPSDKFLEYATIIGFVLIIGLVLFANGLDIWRWLKGKL